MCLAPGGLNLRYFGCVRRQIYVAKVVGVEGRTTCRPRESGDLVLRSLSIGCGVLGPGSRFACARSPGTTPSDHNDPIFPGFKMFCGSSACLIAAMTPSAAAP